MNRDFLRDLRDAITRIPEAFNDWVFDICHRQVHETDEHDYTFTACSCGDKSWPCKARKAKYRREGKFDGSV